MDKGTLAVRTTKPKPIPGFPGYAVDRNGVVYNVKHNRIMKRQLDWRGNFYVRMYNEGQKKGIAHYVSRLVAAAFVKGRTAEKNRVLFKDKDHTNVNAGNLYWATHKTAIRLGKQPVRKGVTGEANPLSKLTRAQVRRLRRDYAKGNTSHRLLSIRYGITTTAVYKILHRKTWKEVTP